jgi:hypothetical protein
MAKSELLNVNSKKSCNGSFRTFDVVFAQHFYQYDIGV